jgi:Ca-activated chloride channel family protein
LVEELGDKVLTFLFSACANILNRFEDFMVRQNGRRSSCSGALIRKTTPISAWAKTTSAFPRIPVCLLTFLVLVLAFTLPVFAQSPDVDDIHIAPRGESDKSEPANAGDSDTLRTHSPMITKKVDLVLVPVTVTDPMNRLVTGLDKDNFQVYEGKEQQDLRHFSSEDAPISLGVIFDMSGSMSSKIERAREAVTEFFRTANPQDEFFLIAFADKPEEISDFTQSVDDLQGKLIYTVPKGRTALLDAIYLGVSKMRQAKYPKKALLIISDGGDNHSRYTEGEIKSLVKEADVMVYSIGIYDHYFATEEERLGPALLGDVSELSGGRSFTIDNPNDLADVATKIGIELRNQYVLGYRPRNPGHDGKWHKIKIKLLPPKGLPPLHVYAKTGYYASSQ